MSFRITPHRQYEIGQQRSLSQASRTATLRDQISSGERVHRPSDDPHAQRLILNSQSTASHFQTQGLAINDVRSILNEAHVQVRSAQQLTVNARDVGLQIRSLNNQSEATVFAQELDGILETLDTIANASYDGRYLFSGSTIENRPYDDVTISTNYQGVEDSGSTQIAGAGHIKTYYSGHEVFSTGLDGLTAVLGSTGAAPGPGTASGHGTSQLQVSHGITTYAPASGIQTGVSSSAADTIIGASGVHTLEITDTSGTGTSGTISLNGGEPIAFTSGDTDLQLTGPSGEVVFVDTTAITAGFSGTVDIAATGTLSLDDGLTTVDIDFSENQTLVDQQGNVRHINSQGITQAGVDTVQLEGNSDLFETLRSMRDDLLNFENFSAADWDNNVTEFIGQTGSLSDHLLDTVGEQSVDLATLDRLQERGEDLQLEAELRLGELQGTDFATAVLQLQEEQNLTDFTVAVLAGVFHVSVLDFIS